MGTRTGEALLAEEATNTETERTLFEATLGIPNNMPIPDPDSRAWHIESTVEDALKEEPA